MNDFNAISQEENTIQWLSSQTPVELLTEANRGFRIRDIDHSLILELQERGYPDGIINVMLYYVLVRSRGLRFDEVRNLADSWNEVRTVREAVILGEDAFQEWEDKKNIPSTNRLR